MKTTSEGCRRPFYAVQFIQLPFEGIDDYVCVPHSWIILRRSTDRKVLVAYPNDEDPFDTRDRAKRKEKYGDEWKFYLAIIKYESDTYGDADFWIATRNDYGPFAEENSKIKDTQPESTLDRKWRSAILNHSSGSKKSETQLTMKTNDNPLKPTMKISIKRLNQSDPKDQLDKKRLKLDEAAMSTRGQLPIHNPVNKKIQPSSPAQELQRSTESNYANYKADSQTIRIMVSSDGQNTTNISKQFYQKIEPPQQRQVQPNHQNLPRDPHVPRIHVGISIRSKNNNQSLSFHGPTKRTPPSVQPEFSNSMRHAFVTGYGIENVVASACQTDGSITDEPLSLSYEGALDNEAVSSHDMSTNETPVEITNDVDCIQITSESNSADRLTAPQRSTMTNLQKHPRSILEQQMLNNFATLLTQMGSTLAYTSDMLDNLRSSIRESADTYKNILDAVEKFNTLGNSATTSSSSSNVTSDVPQVIEERRTEVSEGGTSVNGSQCNSNVVKDPPKGKRKIRWTFALPPEYDPNDTRWTLKYRENEPGLVELMPESDIYICYGELKNCTEVSTNCKTLAKLLLPEIFSKSALSVCESLTERAKASNNEGSRRRPELDTRACIFMVKFIQEHALKRGWDTSDSHTENFLKGIHGKMLEMRFKYGRMVRY